ncbi:hypothetical protein SAY86_016624 [Trapa natans]|uniref:Uncharacterized protein n=1 Tax=Trapa natans TaxID=22666 RepID=A0AAN7QXC5_TRANT|nr:hypothetical protein SAY86_016624 [Trapa natans]
MATPSPTDIHILLYPYPAPGHIIPILDLARRLLAHPGVTVTVLVIPTYLPLLRPLLSEHPPPALHSLILPEPPLPPPSSSSSSMASRVISSMRGLRDLHLPLLRQWFASHALPPAAIVSDFFLGWTHHLARQIGIPRVVFSPSGAFGLAVAYSLWKDLPKLITESPEVSFPDLPNCPSFPIWQISAVCRGYLEAADPSLEFFREDMLADLASWGLLLNSFDELERNYIDHLKRVMGHERVWAAGPLVPAEDDVAERRGGHSSVPTREVVTWLDSCDDGSVVYVCFGSRGLLTPRQMDELAAGLEWSGVRFVLCCGGGVSVPAGLEQRVAGRGLVIRGWAPQVVILRHRAVGAFLTHCGWNSVMEGIAAGVVMLTWPMGSDQYTNAKLLVDQLGVGIGIGEGAEIIPEAAKLGGTLRDSVKGDRAERVRAEGLRKAALSATEAGGSSELGVDGFMRSLRGVQRGGM